MVGVHVGGDWSGKLCDMRVCGGGWWSRNYVVDLHRGGD